MFLLTDTVLTEMLAALVTAAVDTAVAVFARVYTLLFNARPMNVLFDALLVFKEILALLVAI